MILRIITHFDECLFAQLTLSGSCISTRQWAELDGVPHEINQLVLIEILSFSCEQYKCMLYIERQREKPSCRTNTVVS